MWELDNKNGWVPKNWCYWTMVLESSLESPLDCKEIKPVNPKGNHHWIFIGRTDAEALMLWPPDAKSQLIGKDPDSGKDWKQEEQGMTEDEIVGWHHQLNGHEFDQILRNSERQRSLVCCSPWGCKDSDKTEWLSWTEFLNLYTTWIEKWVLLIMITIVIIIRYWLSVILSIMKNYLFNCSTAICVCILPFWLIIMWNLRCNTYFPWILTRTYHFLILKHAFSMTQHSFNLEHKSKCYSKEVK